jgi:hypothetical protein
MSNDITPVEIVIEVTDPDEGDQITCWCGATGTYDELFSPLPARCGGLGVIDCHCGGDLCVCHNHGQIDCDGCADCDEADDDEWYDNDE